MIAFFADNHYSARPGFHLAQKLDSSESILFNEDDLSQLPKLLNEDDCHLLILNWIGGTCNLPHPDHEIEAAVKDYLLAGRPMLLLHGASAAFHEWEWWREIVGLRWVRAGDPDGFEPSTHPVEPYSVSVAKTRHPLAKELKPFSLPKDEIYINLEQTSPITTLMTMDIAGKTFPQAYITETPFGGKIIGFLPGHAPAAFDCPELVENVETMIQFLLDEGEEA